MPVPRLFGPPPSSEDKSGREQIDAIISKYTSLTPDEKRNLAREVSTFIGGTAGGAAGGFLLGGPPGAIAGAALGGATGYASARAGETMEGAIRGQPLPPDTPLEDLQGMGEAALMEAAGEGVGRAIPAGMSMGKTALKNALRRPFQQDAATKKIVALADQHGIPLNIAQRSGKEVLFLMQGALERLPFSSDILRKSYLKQYGQWADMMNGLMDGVRAGKVGEAEFAAIAESSIKQLRDEFAGTMNKEVLDAAAKISPEPVTLEQAGRALREGVDANRSALSKWAAEAYGGLRQRYGKTPVDLEPLAESAKTLLDDIPEDQWKQFFPGPTLKKLQTAAAAVPQESGEFLFRADEIAAGLAEGATYKNLNPEQQKNVASLVERIHGLSAETVEATTLTFSEALQLRSSLHKSAGRIGEGGDANNARLLDEMADGVSDSINKAFAENPSALEELGPIQATYKEKKRALYPPMAPGRPGNVQAGRIVTEARPERLPRDIAGSPSATRETVQAVSPETTADIVGGPPQRNRLPEFQRSLVEDVGRRSAVNRPDAFTSFVSPSKFGEEASKLESEAYGPFADVVKQPSREALQARESLLMRDPFAKAASRSETRGTMRAAFPKKDPRQAERTLSMLGETGQREAGQRAFGDDLLEQSKTASREIDIRFTNPRTLERHLEEYGPTTSTVLGGGATRGIREAVDLGKTVTRAEIFQPSGTAKALEALQAGKEAGQIVESVVVPIATGGGFWKGLGTAAKKGVGLTGLPYAAAKKFTDPGLSEWLTKSAQPLPFAPGGMAAGALGRAGAHLLPPAPPSSGNDTIELGDGDWLPRSENTVELEGGDWLPASGR